MKNLILATLFASSFGAFAAPAVGAASNTCPDIASVQKLESVGHATTLDVLRAFDCALSSTGACRARVGLRRDILTGVKQLFAVGEVTRAEVQAAQQALRETLRECGK